MEEEKKYKITMWCDDCSYGQDPQGCFDGGTEDVDVTFSSREEAEEYVEENELNLSPRNYDIFKI
jgi:hypothetical protein